jgi:hypothetical protein
LTAARRAVAAAVAVAAGSLIAGVTLPASLAGADSFTPVGLTITIAPVARLHAPLKVSVAVNADAGVLDVRTAPLRVQVRLANECGGAFAYTSGPVLLNERLSPQPATGHAYSGVLRGAGKPSAYGSQTVCVWLAEEGDGRVFASDQSLSVDVSKPCTTAAARYDAARRALARALRDKRGVTRRRKAARAAHQAALRACGARVPL